MFLFFFVLGVWFTCGSITKVVVVVGYVGGRRVSLCVLCVSIVVACSFALAVLGELSQMLMLVSVSYGLCLCGVKSNEGCVQCSMCLVFA